MPNIFDQMASSVFKTTTNVMGYDASWTPFGQNVPLLARVHLKDPNKKGDEGEMERVDFHYTNPIMEYMEPDFPGLYELAEHGGREHVIINGPTGLQSFGVDSVTRIWDGKTYKAILIPD